MILRGLALFTAATVILTGCGTHKTRPRSSPETEPITVSELTTSIPALHNVTSAMKSVVHVSRSGIDDTATHVTTSVFVPKGSPPAGGFPMVALGHRTTGLTADCAPSVSPDLLDLAPTVEALLKAGYVVTVPDYQGLGKQSTDKDADHYYPYLDSTTAAYNMIDAAYVTRRAVPQTSKTWIAMGVNEGGQAAWAANELADNYDYDMNLVGSVSISPMSDLTELIGAAQSGTLNDAQKVVLARFVAALHTEYPDNVKLDDFRRGAAQQHWDALLGCQPVPTALQIAAQVPATDLKPATGEALSTLRGYLQKTTLPQGPAQNPMLVSYSGTEPFSPGGWTETALKKACKLGNTITIEQVPDPQPDSVLTLSWIADRFKSVPAPNNCARLTR